MSDGARHLQIQPGTIGDDQKTVHITVRPRTSSTSSLPSLRTPRTARFSEATAVHSPIEMSKMSESPFADPRPGSKESSDATGPSAVGFGYLSEADAHRHDTVPTMPQEGEVTTRYLNAPASPLKSALKSPGTPGRRLENPLSPTFREEQILEKQEERTEKQNARDLKVKARVRVAKLFLRTVNFSCSLIVLSMLAATFTIFNATKTLPKRNNLPPWALGQKIWPQVVLLCMATISLFMSLVVFYGYWRGGHKRAEKVAVYYTVFAVSFFVFSVVMWGIGAAILNQSRQTGNNKDMWGWSCVDNERKSLFEKEVNYALVCRMQNWSLVCALIEIVIELLTILIYAVVFYRFYSKNRLRKSMDLRDRARSDLYLAQLRSQSAPNTPGFMKSPMSATFAIHDPHDAAEQGDNIQYAQKNQSFSQPKPFTLQPPPIRVQNATPQIQQNGFEAPPSSAPAPAPLSQHAPVAPGEQQYDAVPIPGAYASPLSSPSYAPPPQSMQHGQPGQAYTAESRIDSRPASPEQAYVHKARFA
ncbi:hypothetical protein L228DRAFT_19846 [Xylona heveae TC161]|uniref:Hyphal anastamosis-8 protein n=1 Tax=Xylona heveae (strain CBS 132557 / TC161) TaxID=1328760 RepID=A0A165K0Y6_XYLHT|nr:hypothetical protein L228DRAFT_19846 [Xylona heveae TC161]KZF26867.1 hypothetical protein L228DRAFT_19846 [Xylona heveae TC161]